MADPKIVQFLRQLSRKERQRFLDFSKSYLKEVDNLLLGYLIITCNRNKEINEGTMDDILNVDTSQSPNRSRIYYRIKDCLLHFLETEQLKKKEFALLEPILLLYRLRDTQASNLLEKTIARGKRLVKKQLPDGTLSFRLRHWFMDDSYFHPIMQENGAKTAGLESMNTYFCFEILRFACKVKTANRLKENSLDMPFLQEAMKLSRQAAMDAIPLIKIYRQYLELHEQFLERTYMAFKSIVIKELENLAPKEQTFVFNLLINQISHAIRLDSKFLADIQMVYELGIREKYLMDDKWLIKEHFINFINTTCALGDVEMAEKFFKANRASLHSNCRADVKLVCLSRIKIARKEYKEAFALLNGKNYKDEHLRLIGRANRIKACYDWEMEDGHMLLDGEEISLDAQLKSFYAMLDFLKESFGAKNERIIANYNFHEMVSDLLRKNNDVFPQKWRKTLMEKLKRLELVACRIWLTEKVNELGNK